MTDALLAALFVLLSWWGSTGIILLMDGLPRSTFRVSLLGTSLLAGAGLVGLFLSSRSESKAGAYVAFGSALVVWAWHELTFLLGVITGPRKEPCPPEASFGRRFLYGTAAVLYHEVALALTVLLLVGLTWGAPNQVGTFSFVVLWVMRVSAKLNVFLGVRNLTTDFIPPHLRYMISYFRKARLNPLMPVSLLLGGAVVVQLVSDALSPEATAFAQVGRSMVATLLGLAVLEHLFLILPIPDALLWRWALRPGHAAPAADRAAPVQPAPETVA